MQKAACSKIQENENHRLPFLLQQVVGEESGRCGLVLTLEATPLGRCQIRKLLPGESGSYLYNYWL